MSAAACKVVIDCTAGLIGKLLCLGGSATIADTVTPGTVDAAFAQRFERLANRFGSEVDKLISELDAAILDDEAGGAPERDRD